MWRYFNNYLKKAKPRFCLFPQNRAFAFFPPFADTSARGRGETAALNNMRMLINAAMRGKPLGVPLRSQKFVLSAQNKFREPFILQFCYKIRGRIIQAGVILKAQSSKE